MSRTRHLPRLLAAAALALLAASCGKSAGGAKGPAYGTADNPINFSILSAENQQSMGPIWAPLLDDLRKDTGLVMKPFFATNYSLLVEAMRAHKVQAGWFSALPSLEAARRADGEVIARAVNAQGGAYKSVLIVRKGSGITLDRVLKCDKTLSFGLGDTKSTSGTLAPLAFLFTPRGIDPQTCFKQVRSASHQANLLSIANGVLDAATNNSVGLIFAKRENPDVAAKVQTIWTSPDLPEAAIVVRRRDLDPKTVEKLQAFFAGYGKAAGPDQARRKHVLEILTYIAFDKADNGYLLPVRQMEASNELAIARRNRKADRIEAAQKALDALNAPSPPPIAAIGN